VHWTRANSRSSERASARASVGLPDARQVLDERVAAREDRDDEVLGDLLADLGGLRDVRRDALRQRDGRRDLGAVQPALGLGVCHYAAGLVGARATRLRAQAHDRWSEDRPARPRPSTSARCGPRLRR